MTIQLYHAVLPGPAVIGPIHLVSNDRCLVALEFGDPEHRLLPMLRSRFGPGAVLRAADDPHGSASAVQAYVDGALDAITALPVDGGGTPFQRRVWTALRAIPLGETRSYGQLAAQLGNPGASRAVGLANGRNPISLVVPCHRVIGGSGQLVGYGGGLERKRWLLAHEQGRAQGQLALV